MIIGGGVVVLGKQREGKGRGGYIQGFREGGRAG